MMATIAICLLLFCNVSDRHSPRKVYNCVLTMFELLALVDVSQLMNS